MRDLDVVILAAGLGTRLASRAPKALNTLPDGRTIMQQQVDNIRATLGDRARIVIVVGFKFASIMEHVPDAAFVYNDRFDVTNTNRSLLHALRLTHDVPCLWMNGDVVFHPEVISRLVAYADSGLSAVAVNSAVVAEEEVKYTLDATGHVALLSKQVPMDRACGEAVGVNIVVPADRTGLMARLEACDDQDYFEAGIEAAIVGDGLRVAAVDISDLYAVEVDTADDLAHARVVHAAGQHHEAVTRIEEDARTAATALVPSSGAPAGMAQAAERV